jgi:hypothetical protein
MDRFTAEQDCQCLPIAISITIAVNPTDSTDIPQTNPQTPQYHHHPLTLPIQNQPIMVIIRYMHVRKELLDVGKEVESGGVSGDG